MQTKVYAINSFVDRRGKGGNPAGVVLDADGLTKERMQAIAKEMGFSETAFVQKSKKADFRLRFFTPIKEVDLCGHATIAAFSLLAQLGRIGRGKYLQETKAGILGVEVGQKKRVFMNQTKPTFKTSLPKDAIADSLGINEKEIREGLPIQVVSTGLCDIMIPVRSQRILDKINPDFKKISRLSKKFGAVGYHVFALKPNPRFDASCRNFAPLYGINEESATGTSCGALACYLFEHKKIPHKSEISFSFEQGRSMKMPSEILAKLKTNNGKIGEIQVGGTAKIIGKKEM
ncbi:MAG: PhzF family phenazine biosynthesis protein [archaeon]|nr:PhzF family phenazine biosynthesis protein [archaeon]